MTANTPAIFPENSNPGPSPESEPPPEPPDFPKQSTEALLQFLYDFVKVRWTLIIPVTATPGVAAVISGLIPSHGDSLAKLMKHCTYDRGSDQLFHR
jgi:hypothetical protein